MLLAKLKFALLGLFTLAVVSTSVGVLAQYAPQTSPGRASDNDRLKSVEQKLDKLLEVLAGAGPLGNTGRRTTRAGPSRIAGALQQQLVLVPVLPTPVTGTSGMMGMMAHDGNGNAWPAEAFAGHGRLEWNRRST